MKPPHATPHHPGLRRGPRAAASDRSARIRRLLHARSASAKSSTASTPSFRPGSPGAPTPPCIVARPPRLPDVHHRGPARSHAHRRRTLRQSRPRRHRRQHPSGAEDTLSSVRSWAPTPMRWPPLPSRWSNRPAPEPRVPQARPARTRRCSRGQQVTPDDHTPASPRSMSTSPAPSEDLRRPGRALAREPDGAIDILKAVREALPPEQVTSVKMRAASMTPRRRAELLPHLRRRLRDGLRLRHRPRAPSSRSTSVPAAGPS